MAKAIAPVDRDLGEIFSHEGAHFYLYQAVTLSTPGLPDVEHWVDHHSNRIESAQGDVSPRLDGTSASFQDPAWISTLESLLAVENDHESWRYQGDRLVLSADEVDNTETNWRHEFVGYVMIPTAGGSRPPLRHPVDLAEFLDYARKQERVDPLLGWDDITESVFEDIPHQGVLSVHVQENQNTFYLVNLDFGPSLVLRVSSDESGNDVVETTDPDRLGDWERLSRSVRDVLLSGILQESRKR